MPSDPIGHHRDDQVVGRQSALYIVQPVVDTGRVRDPVYGMEIPSAQAAASTEVGHQYYWFCSRHCEKTFLADPARYLSHDAHDVHDHDGVAHDHAPTGVIAVSTSTKQLAKDPICGMIVNKATALSAERGG